MRMGFSGVSQKGVNLGWIRLNFLKGGPERIRKGPLVLRAPMHRWKVLDAQMPSKTLPPPPTDKTVQVKKYLHRISCSRCWIFPVGFISNGVRDKVSCNFPLWCDILAESFLLFKVENDFFLRALKPLRLRLNLCI